MWVVWHDGEFYGMWRLVDHSDLPRSGGWLGGGMVVGSV